MFLYICCDYNKYISCKLIVIFYWVFCAVLNLRYKIVVALVCDTCFDKNTDYVSNDVNVKIHNIASPTFDDDKFENLFNGIISTL